MEELQKKIQNLINNYSKESFIFELLSIYGNTRTTIKRLRDGDKNKLEKKGELELRSKLFFKTVENDLYKTIDEIKSKLKGKRTDPRFVIVTNYDHFLSFDTKTKDTLDIKLDELDKNYSFFLPWIGIEKTQYQDENIADVKAAQNLAKLYDEITKTNPHKTEDEIHSLNIFLSRLLFCYFAEDTNIFKKNQFTNTLSSNTNLGGEDTKSVLENIFKVFNQHKDIRDNRLPEYLNNFPYVNGKLFMEEYSIPHFTTKSRKILIEMGSLDWSNINPDIFGSMMQAVVDSEQRGSLGMHYTSVPNIMKLIKPLFLDELQNEFKNSIGNAKKLESLKKRLSQIKFFDPACGSGNFLIITYKEIRRIEIGIIKELQSGTNLLPGMSLFFSDIKLSQFYGIEIDSFAHETAKLSMYLAEHQMNVEFEKETGFDTQPLPLKEGGNIVQGNAARVNWEEVCHKEDNDEIYILGNPPYLGSSLQDENQKKDMEFVLSSLKSFKKLDYISIWFYKGAKYIMGYPKIKMAFVTTNSISQGEQVNMFWPNIFDNNLETFFAHTSFKWKNNAKGNAGVTVVIIGLRNINKQKRYIYYGNLKKEVKNINAYLVNANNNYIKKRNKSFIKTEPLKRCGYIDKSDELFLTEAEFNGLNLNKKDIDKFFVEVIGGREMLNGLKKYGLWITKSNLEEAENIKLIKDRIDNTLRKRQNQSEPYRFCRNYNIIGNKIIVPRVSSENRNYIPIIFNTENIAVNDSVITMHNAELWTFGVITSRMHMTWMRTVAGRLKTDYRYSSTLVYNTFPFPKITEKQKEEITELVYEILYERAKHSEKTLAQMYDPEKMPKGLKYAHHQLDLVIEKIYRPKPFENDEERLEYLFKLYEKMIDKEKDNLKNKK